MNDPSTIGPPATAPPTGPPTQAVVRLAVTTLFESPHNPRQTFDEKDLLAFGAELKAHGVKTPLRVIPRGERYEVLAGNRRLKAARLAGIEHLPAIIGPELTPTEIRIDQLLDNDAHDSLTVLDRAACYQRLMRDNGWTAVTLAGKLGCSESKISKALAVKSSLVPDVQELVRAGSLGVSLAYDLARLDSDTQRKFGTAVAGEEMTEAEARAAVARIGRAKKAVRATVGFELTTFEAVRAKLADLLAQLNKLEKMGAAVTALKTLWK